MCRILYIAVNDKEHVCRLRRNMNVRKYLQPVKTVIMTTDRPAVVRVGASLLTDRRLNLVRGLP